MKTRKWLRRSVVGFGSIAVLYFAAALVLTFMPEPKFTTAPGVALAHPDTRDVQEEVYPYEDEGIHIRQNNEPAAGQDVFHLHLHVIPRYQGDGFDTKRYERLPLQKRRELSEKLKPAVQREIDHS